MPPGLTVMPRFLYVYDIEGWAIHQVGRTWAKQLAGRALFEFATLAQARALSVAELQDYRSCILGFTNLLDGVAWHGLEPTTYGRYATYQGVRRELRMALVAPLRDTPSDRYLRRSLAVLHDPMEIFPERPDWQGGSPWLSRLRRFSRVAVTSDELHRVLDRARVSSSMVRTRPDIDIRHPSEVVTVPGRPLSVCANRKRKNIPLLRALKEVWDAAADTAFTLTVGHGTLSRAEYTGLLDEHSVYVCTSWQEGGPLPVMEAVSRGLAVVTTNVGQVARWVIHGRNGLICRTPAEFHSALERLRSTPDLLLRMRLASLEIAAERRQDDVTGQLTEFLAL